MDPVSLIAGCFVGALVATIFGYYAVVKPLVDRMVRMRFAGFMDDAPIGKPKVTDVFPEPREE